MRTPRRKITNHGRLQGMMSAGSSIEAMPRQSDEEENSRVVYFCLLLRGEVQIFSTLHQRYLDPSSGSLESEVET